MASADNFNFDLIGGSDPSRAFQGYNSAKDPTLVDPRYAIKGTKNVYLTNRGTWAVRPGLKLSGELDGTEDGITSSYEFQTAQGDSLPLRVLESGKLQFRYQGDWYTLDESDKTNYAWTTWWEDHNKVTLLVFVRNDANIYSWSGAIAPSVGAVNAAGVLISGSSPQTDSLSLSVTNADERMETANNTLDLGSARSGVVLKTNPNDNDELQYVIASNSTYKSASVTLRFVTTLPGSPSSLIGYILIGATKEDTAANLLGFLQSPGTTTATHVEISDSDAKTAIGYESYAQVDSLAISGTDTWAELGFTDGYPAVGSSIVVDGTEYTYTLVSSTYLLNISGVPTQGVVAYQGVYTAENKPDEDFVNDFCLTLNNQLIVGSRKAKIIYISEDTNYTNFVNTGDVVYGDPDFAILDEFPVGGIAKGDSAYIAAGDSSWYVVTPNTPIPYVSSIGRVVITKIEKQVGAVKSAALGHDFIATIGEDIIYLSKDHQLRTLGTLRNIVTPKTPSLSKAVRQELLEEDFTGGALRVVTDQDEFVYITAPATGRDYLYQIRDDVDDVGNLTATRLWQPPQTRNLSRIAVIDGVVYGYSAEFPQLYQLWDTGQWHDDTPYGPALYVKVLRMAYRQFSGERTEVGDFDKVYYEGYILPRSGLTAVVYNDYQGATDIQEYELSGLTGGVTVFSTEGVKVIGESTIGDTTIGGGVPDPSYEIDIPKFRVIQNVFQQNCFEYALELKDATADSRWEILALGPTAEVDEMNPVQLQKNG